MNGLVSGYGTDSEEDETETEIPVQNKEQKMEGK